MDYPSTKKDWHSTAACYESRNLAVDFDAVEGLHFSNDLPHGQNVFRVGVFSQDFQETDGVGFFRQHGTYPFFRLLYLSIASADGLV